MTLASSDVKPKLNRAALSEALRTSEDQQILASKIFILKAIKNKQVMLFGRPFWARRTSGQGYPPMPDTPGRPNSNFDTSEEHL